MIDRGGSVIGVASDGAHNFSKLPRQRITLLAGLGVEGDAHCGEKVKHRSRVAVDPSQPNLRQVHLLPIELIEELGSKGYRVDAAQLGENVTTQGLDLISLPLGTILRIGRDAEVKITGLRNPCQQIEKFLPGLLAEVVGKASDGEIERRAGVMGIVTAGGDVRPGDAIHVVLPPEPHLKLERV